MTGLKRSLDESGSPRDADGGPSPRDVAPIKSASPAVSQASGGGAAASSFRNVSACNRCRLRKNRCDQSLPSCATCDKAGVKCVGYDPITKREIPRSYVYYLETRVTYLEALLQEHAVAYTPSEDFNPTVPTTTNGATARKIATPAARNGASRQHGGGAVKEDSDRYDREKLSKLVSNIGMVSVQGASDPRYLGSTSGISFARVVFAAVKSTVSGTSSERGSAKGVKPPPPPMPTSVADGGTSMRDSFFGLHTKPTIRQAPFPDRDVASRLVDLYFEHANPQIPILHRGEFVKMFDRVYSSPERTRTSRESYMLNIVFAIGAGIIVGSSAPEEEEQKSATDPAMEQPSTKRRRLGGHQSQPEEYHASAIVHLENFLSSTPAADRPDGFGGGLEELQAVLLLAGFALLRPVAPGLWYIVGVAVRLGVDLGLHYEDGVQIDRPGAEEMAGKEPELKREDNSTSAAATAKLDAKEKGRREWVRDLRRRLWWCVYSLDRLVSTCVGRPFGISDEVVTTEFPSLLDDKFITKEGFLDPQGQERPTYKVVSYHYFRLRLLQSEVLQVLQHRQSQQARASGANEGNIYMHTKLSSPFLVKFSSFRAWRVDIDRRLAEWKDSSPTQLDTGVQFSPLFLELNYWQAVIMLYRQSLAVPDGLANELGSTDGSVGSPSMTNLEEREDEEVVFLKVAEAGQKVLKLYRQLHRVHLVNYTFLATHHLFMAGISFLYAVWHSVAVRSLLSLDDVDFTVLAATSVLGDLVEKCPPAEACRDAFDRMSKATISMCMSTTGFGPQALRALPPSRPLAQAIRSSGTAGGGGGGCSAPAASGSDTDARSDADVTGLPRSSSSSSRFTAGMPSRRPIPKFDMNLRDLFSEDETNNRVFSRVSNQIDGMRPPLASQQQHIKQEPGHQQQMAPFTDTIRVSPQLRNQHPEFFDPDVRPQQAMSSPQQQHQQQQHQQQQQRQHHRRSSQQQHQQQQPHQAQPLYPHPPNLSPNTLSQQPYTYTTFSQPYPDLGGFSDLDFLDSAYQMAGAEGGAAMNIAQDGLQDLGFGMGLGDGMHDFADGNGFDLFDGFFFGPQAGQGGGAGAGGGVGGGF